MLLRAKLITGQAWKEFVSHVRCAEYPDPAKFEAERATIEKAWPAFASDPSLYRLDRDLWAQRPAFTIPNPWMSIRCDRERWVLEGKEWIQRFNRRLQHTLSCMNHHIHPLNAETGERYVLSSCKPKDKKQGKICKHDPPLTQYLCAIVLPRRGDCKPAGYEACLETSWFVATATR